MKTSGKQRVRQSGILLLSVHVIFGVMACGNLRSTFGLQEGSGAKNGFISILAGLKTRGGEGTGTYAIGGTVTGLKGGSELVLQLNKGGDIRLTASDAFVFPEPMSPGDTFEVTISSQPVSQVCSVSNLEKGIVSDRDVAEVRVFCEDIRTSYPNPYPLRIHSLPNGGFVVTTSTTRQLWYYGKDGNVPRVLTLDYVPIGVAVSSRGEVFVGDQTNKTIKVYSALTGEYIRSFGEVDFPNDIAVVDVLNRIYVTDSIVNVIKMYDLDGTALGVIGTGIASSTPGEFSGPAGIAYNPTTNELLVADYGNMRMQALTPAGAFVRIFHNDSLPATSCGSLDFGCEPMPETGIGRPMGVAVDSLGNIYVSDVFYNTVAVYNSAGNFLYRKGENGEGPGELRVPTDLIVRENGELLVANTYNGRIERIFP